MITNLLLRIPKTPGTKVQLEYLHDFLRSPMELGVKEVKWECPTSKHYFGIRVERSTRTTGTYYRDPYPIFLSVQGHTTPGMPVLEVLLSNEDLDLLLKEIRRNLT